MYVRELMTLDPVFVRPDATVHDAALAMADGDFGILPIVENGALEGVVTDRDLCMAATANGEGSMTRVGEIAHRPVYECSAEDDVAEALAIMRSHQVRRLPVVDGKGHLEGILSMNDVVLAARARPEIDGAPSYDQVVDTMRSICQHHA